MEKVRSRVELEGTVRAVGDGHDKTLSRPSTKQYIAYV